jgi:hypothetical protein
MTTRPTSFPSKLWASKLMDDKLKAAVAKAWDNDVSDSDKADIKNEGDQAVAIDILKAAIDYDETGKTPDKAMESPAPMTAFTGDVAAWIKEQKAKVTPELSTFVHDTVDLQLKNDERKILLFVEIDKAGLDVPAMDSKPDPTANTAAKQLGDYYEVPGKTLDSKPVPRHRLHDLADQLFGNGYVAEVTKLEGMGDDAIKDYGTNKYREDLGTAKKKLSVLRRKFSEACDAVVAYRECNALGGIVVIVGNTKSPTPFQLRELTGKPAPHDIDRTTPITIAELEAYRPKTAKELFDGGKLKRAGSETEPGTMYDAIRGSRPPKKPRGTGKQGQGQKEGTTSAAGKDVTINNINQWESGSADMAAMVEATGTMGDWLKRANDPDKAAADAFLLSEYKIMKFHDRVFSMNDSALMKRAAALLEADAVAEAAKKAA